MLSDAQLTQQLKKHFHYDYFRIGQAQIIGDILEGKDVLGILPTGSGKSICYQLPSLLLDGLTIVVSPLISLMIDQVKELKAKNIKQVAYLNSFIQFNERKRILHHLDQYKLLYVSPELLQQELLMEKLKDIKVSLFVIDEAHCISQWGHEFRPDYLKLHEIIAALRHPTVLALSATATPEVQEDIIQSLDRSDMQKRIYPMDRNNLTFVVEQVSSEQNKSDWLITYLEKRLGATLIYFSSRSMTEKISYFLKEQMPELRIAFYHGGMDANDRVMIQQQFMNGQLDIICCTSAFGMGINKQDIRVVIHYHMPAQIESYIQEVGRAGRDGKPSLCLLLYSPKDISIQRKIIESELPDREELSVIIQQIKHIARENIPLPSSVAEASELFQISEIKWRFLRFHFEKHGMIEGRKVFSDKKKWECVYTYLMDWIYQRIIHKQNELKEMIHWSESDQCLRELLYNKFQKGYEEPVFQCCNNCGIKLSEWQPEDVPNRSNSSYLEWRTKLRKVLIGEMYETK